MKRVNRCLNQKLVDICLQSYQLDKLNEIVKSLLPSHLQSECSIASFRQGRLLISVSDPTFATELRYLLPTIRDHLRRDYKLYQLIQCETVIDNQQNNPVNLVQNKQTRKVGSKAKQTIHLLAESVDHPPLKSALQKLAEHL